MDRIEKILLGSEDVINKGLPDIFLTVDLNKAFKEIKKEYHENTFDVRKQFEEERNTSRNFRIYGIVNSTIANCDNLSIRVYRDSGYTQLITTLTTMPLEFQKGNVFNKKMGKYYLELDNYLQSSVYFVIPGNGVNYSNQNYEQKLVFFDADNQFVPYGTETVDINDDGTTIEINNNFPFFYNKHWVKKDLDILEIKPTYVQFSSTGQTVTEGGNVLATIELGRPSIFGNEIVNLVLNTNLTTLNPTNDFSILINNTPVSNTNATISFSAGEQYKTLKFVANTDYPVEFEEYAFYDLKNHANVTTGVFNSNNFTVKDNTTRTYAEFDLGTMWANRLGFSGRGYYPSWSPTVYQSGYYSSPSIFRNGHFHEGRNEEFWPVDYFYVDIFNQGVDTIIPPNPIFNITTDTIFKAGTSQTFKVFPIYTSSTYSEVKIHIPPTAYFPFYSPAGEISINGLRITPDISPTYGQAFKAFLNSIDGGSGDFYINRGLEKPFTIVSVDNTGNTVTLRSVSNGVELKISPNLNNSPTPSDYATVTVVTPFVYSDQLPLKFTLLGNDSANNMAKYDFVFRKPGYATGGVYGNSFAAGSSAITHYLITSYRDALVPYDPVNNACVLPSVIPDNTNSTITYAMPYTNQYTSINKNGVYTHGICFLAVKTSHPSILNYTAYGDNVPGSPYNVTTGERMRFVQNPISPIPCTYTNLSFSSVSQKGVLVINSNYVNPSNVNVGAINSQTRGIRFINNSGQTQHYYKLFNNVSFGNNALYWWNSMSWPVYWSSSTVSAVNTPGLQQLLDVGNTGFTTPIPVGPVYATFPGPIITSTGPNYSFMSNQSAISLQAKVPGIPFEIQPIDIVWQDIIGNYNTGNTLGQMTIYYIPVVPNEIAGVTVNPYNAKMGGFTMTPPL